MLIFTLSITDGVLISINHWRNVSMQRRSKIDDTHVIVRQVGGWETVYRCYPELFDAMNKSPEGQSKAVKCPLSGQGKTVFRLYRDWREKGGGYHNDHGRFGDGIDLIAWMEGISKSQAMDRIIEICGGNRNNISIDEAKRVRDKREQSAQLTQDQINKNAWVLNKVESETISAQQSKEIYNYLCSRGLMDYFSIMPSSIGYNSNLQTFSKEGKKIVLNGMVFYIQNGTGNPVSMHRIFLQSDGFGKSELVENAKMQLSGIEDVRGSAIRLGMPISVVDSHGNTRRILAVCEGPETGMAITLAEKLPVWCGISSTLMELMFIPDDITDLLIFEDRDRVKDMGVGEGQRAALCLKERINRELPHVSVHNFSPPTSIPDNVKSVDWLDEWNNSGSELFPNFLSTI